ncbi:MAG: alpha/beta fold hydrolase [Sphingomonas sp.]
MPLLPEHSALQHERAPRPLPLFLELVREVSAGDPELARAALAGLRAYERAARPSPPPARPEIERVRGAALRDHGGSGPPALLVPSLINPPRVLDLDEEVSLTAAIARMGRRVLLLDWGSADERSDLSVAAHVEELLIPLLSRIGNPVALIGYCLGGTMAIAAANHAAVESVVTIAAPWHFNRYPGDSRRALADIWRNSEAAARQLGALPMEVLQAAFWSIDPHRTVRKFADFERLAPSTHQAHRFVELEDWANGGESLPYPAAKELIEAMFGEDRPGQNAWCVGGEPITDLLGVPSLHLVAEHDRIAPAATAPVGKRVIIPSGHVGMIVGSSRERLHDALRLFLEVGR